MKRIAAVLMLCAFSSSAVAAEASCSAQAAEKKLAGAAKNSFMKRCETDAKAACETSAKDKKLAGAAKNSFTKKCLEDSTGSK